MFKSINEKMMITKYFDSIIILRLGMKKKKKKKKKKKRFGMLILIYLSQD